VLLRALAVLATVLIPLLLAVEAVSQLHASMFWIGPVAAVVCTLPILLKSSDRAQVLVGAALAAMAAATTPRLPELLRITGDEQSLPVHDLREGPLPREASGYVAVRGYLRDEYVVDEYHPAQGQRPNENLTPDAVLLPLLGTNATDLHAEQLGRVVVARVKPERVAAPIVTLRGKLGPVNQEIVDSLFVVQVQGQTAGMAPPRIEAVQLDTLDVPTRPQALTRLGLAVGAAVLALVLLWLALPRAAKPAARKP
jgi:hypothetical protein